MAVFAEFSENGLKKNVLLSIRQLDKTTNQNAQNHSDTTILDEFGSCPRNIIYIVADNTRLNPAVSNILRVPFIGCASHRLACAVKIMLGPFKIMLDKINSIMVDLSASSNRMGALKRYSNLEPINRNETRWTSQFNQMDRFFKLMEIIKEHYVELEIPAQHLLTLAEEEDFFALFRKLKSINDVTIKIQDVAITMIEVRDLLDMLELDFPGLGRQIQVTSDLIHSRAFESGLQKLHGCSYLTEVEKIALSDFKKPAEIYIRSEVHQNENYAEHGLREAKRRRMETVPSLQYYDTNYVSPTSNIVERLFSRAKFAWSNMRKSMTPAHLEMLIFLRLIVNFGILRRCLN